MNSSHSTTLSIADPLHTPTKAARASRDRSSGGRASDSFNVLYHREAVSFDNRNLGIDNNINSLTGRNEKTEASKATSTQLKARENGGALLVHESFLRDDMDEISDLAEHDLSSEDQTFDTELLHGISVALPSNIPQSKEGEIFPLSGKELPHSGEPSEGKSLLMRPTAESELGDVLAKTDTGIEIRGRSEVVERSDRLRPRKVVDLNSTRSIHSMNERKLETAQSKVQSEPLPESLSLLASLPLQDPATVLTTGNNSATNLAAAVSQIDSMAAQKLNLAADAAANTDLSANVRSSRFERSTVLGEKIHWMRNANISTAELHLHPAELGSIEIRIVTEDQQARISFITSSANARDVIEESLPKLRELLAESGLALDQSDISQKQNGDGNEHVRKDQQALPDSHHIEGEMEHEFIAPPNSSRIGQVDHYV